MGVFTNIVAMASGSSASTDWIPISGGFGSSIGSVSTLAGESISPTSSLGLAPYYACLRNISEDIGKLSVGIFRRTKTNKESDPTHPIAKMMRLAPNPEMSSQTFFETLSHWAMGWGNGYAEIVTNGRGVPVQLWPIHPDRVRIKRRLDGSGALYYEVRSKRMTVEIEPDRMFHLHGLGNGVSGYSVARVAAESLGLTQALEKFGAAFFSNGSTPSGVLTHPEQLGAEEIARLRESWASRETGASGSHRPLILEENMTWKPMGVPPNEAQFIEGRKFQLVEVARWFRMPPHKIQDLERSTFSNIENQSLEYVCDTILPWIKRWESEIARKLLSPTWIDTHIVEFNLETLLRADSKARAEFYKVMQMNGNMTINEVRSKENMNSIGNPGDLHYVPLNMTTAEKMADPNASIPQSTPPPSKPATASAAAQASLPEFIRSASKQEKAHKRAATKYADDPVAFAKWAATFYEAHVCELTSGLVDPAMAVAELVTGDAVDRTQLEERVLGFSISLCNDCKERQFATIPETWAADTAEVFGSFIAEYILEQNNA